jgi:hypothetical protein
MLALPTGRSLWRLPLGDYQGAKRGGGWYIVCRALSMFSVDAETTTSQSRVSPPSVAASTETQPETGAVDRQGGVFLQGSRS